jgi:hypothetical protein
MESSEPFEWIIRQLIFIEVVLFAYVEFLLR